MFHLAHTKIICPKCKKARLEAPTLEGHILGYVCTMGCGTSFDPEIVYDHDKGTMTIWGMVKNPDYIKHLQSAEFSENIAASAKLDKLGIPFHSEAFIIERKAITPKSAAASRNP